MKKLIITTLSLVAGTALLQAQGLIELYNTGAIVSTNTAISIFAGGTGGAGTSGKTTSSLFANQGNGNAYYYALLIAPFGTFTGGTSASTNPASAGWTIATGYALATNVVGYGALSGPGAQNGSTVGNWANGGSTATSDTQGTEMDFLIVGWSQNLGSSWLTVSNELATGSWTARGYFGTSLMGYGYSGGSGSPATPAASLFGVTTTMPGGLSSGFALYLVPEPATIALAGLGGLSLLLFRRRK